MVQLSEQVLDSRRWWGGVEEVAVCFEEVVGWLEAGERLGCFEKVVVAAAVVCFKVAVDRFEEEKVVVGWFEAGKRVVGGFEAAGGCFEVASVSFEAAAHCFKVAMVCFEAVVVCFNEEMAVDGFMEVVSGLAGFEEVATVVVVAMGGSKAGVVVVDSVKKMEAVEVGAGGAMACFDVVVVVFEVVGVGLSDHLTTMAYESLHQTQLVDEVVGEGGSDMLALQRCCGGAILVFPSSRTCSTLILKKISS